MTEPRPLTLETPAEHPFAEFVRILGKGKRGARGLTREEARAAMTLLLEGKVEDTQLGAFLMLLRHKEESAEELAGFTEALRAHLQAPRIAVDLDWPTYAGKKRHLPWYLLAAKCLANNGVRILMHGGGAHTAGRMYTEQLLDLLQIPLCRDWAAVGNALDQHQLAFFPLHDWAPQLQRMIDRPAQYPGPALAHPLAGSGAQPAGRSLWIAEHLSPRLPGSAPRGQPIAGRPCRGDQG